MILCIWLGVVISLILTEILSRNFTAICFVISGIISCILTKYTADYMIQLGQFLIVGILLLIVVRPFVIKRFKKNVKVNKVSSKSKYKEKKRKQN